MKIICCLIALFLLNYMIHFYRRKSIRDNVKTIVKILNDTSISYWLDFGTLLGIVRENDIIWGDLDCDICVRNDKQLEYNLIGLSARLNSYGYRFVHLGSMCRIYFSSIFPDNLLFKYIIGYCDIYINNIDLENQIYIGATHKQMGTSNIPMGYIGTPIAVLWNKTPVFIPEKYHETLTWRYGEDYMVPKRGFKGRDAVLRKRISKCLKKFYSSSQGYVFVVTFFLWTPHKRCGERNHKVALDTVHV